jgi:hypothetical protein
MAHRVDLSTKRARAQAAPRARQRAIRPAAARSEGPARHCILRRHKSGELLLHDDGSRDGTGGGSVLIQRRGVPP